MTMKEKLVPVTKVSITQFNFEFNRQVFLTTFVDDQLRFPSSSLSFLYINMFQLLDPILRSSLIIRWNCFQKSTVYSMVSSFFFFSDKRNITYVGNNNKEIFNRHFSFYLLKSASLLDSPEQSTVW